MVRWWSDAGSETVSTWLAMASCPMALRNSTKVQGCNAIYSTLPTGNEMCRPIRLSKSDPAAMTYKSGRFS